MEPAHRVFLGNLADTFLWQSPLPAVPASTLGRFWSDVFVTSRVPWSSFLESMLWHSLVIAAICLAPSWMPKERVWQRSVLRNSSPIYYTPSKSFSAARSAPPRTHTRAKTQRPSAGQKAMVVPREHHGIVTPPDLKQVLAAARPNLGAPNPALPGVPLSATQPSRLTVPAGPTAVVAPPPSVNQVMAGRAGLPQGSIVAPPPDVAAVSGRRGIAGLGTGATAGAGVIAPPPNVPTGMRRGGDVNIGHSAVVGPAPRLPMHEQSAGSGLTYTMLGNNTGGGSQVVPPPPSVDGTGIPDGHGRANSLASAGAQVVPPAPSVEGGISGGRGSSLAGTGLKVVPPAPTVESAGISSGRGLGSSLSGSGSKVVPPAPSVDGTGFGRGSGNSLSNGGLRVVRPAPSVESAGIPNGRGRGSSLSSGGSQVVPPPPIVDGVGNGTGGGRAGLMASAGSQAALPPQLLPGEEAGYGYAGSADHPAAPSPDPRAGMSPSAVTDQAVAQEMPLRLIGLALALPRSSYFSNYEVFLAEIRQGKEATQLVKLVYTFLPYQRRLSEYVQSNARVYKLRVRRDATCDESILQMSQPEPDPPGDEPSSSDPPTVPPAAPAALPPELSFIDRNSVLPCYRTTADDYRNALERPH